MESRFAAGSPAASLPVTFGSLNAVQSAMAALPATLHKTGVLALRTLSHKHHSLHPSHRLGRPHPRLDLQRRSMVVGSQAPNAVLGAGSEEPAILRLNEGYTFITTWNCPYAQRTWIVLNEKGVHYTPVHVDLQDKPEWFFKYNENGRVPTIVWQAAHEKTQGFGSVYESLVVNEYLEEAHSSPPMLPQDPYGRAQARLLIDQYGQKVAPHFGKLMFAKDDETVKAATEGLNEGLKWLEQRIHPEGPFILGADFSLVDAAIIPFIMRLETLKVLRGFELPSPEEFPRLARWTAAAASRKSVMDTIQPPDEDRSYVDQLVDTTKKMLARMKA